MAIAERALAELVRWIAENGGEPGYVIVSKIKESPVRVCGATRPRGWFSSGALTSAI